MFVMHGMCSPRIRGLHMIRGVEKTLMKMLLASGGVTNPSIRDALLDLLDKPIAESSALCIPTAMYGLGSRGPELVQKFIGEGPGGTLCGLGWKSLGVLELTAIPSLDEDMWVPLVQDADALVVGGGDPLYLNYWMRQSGLADLLPSLRAVWVGQSAGSMIMAPSIGQEFVGWTPPGDGGDRTLGLVDFAMFPHLDYPGWSENTMASAEKWAARMPVPSYAIDDASAISVVDGKVEVVSEGHWRYFEQP